MEIQFREIRRYIKPNGTVPFAEWFTALRDVNAKIRIDKRLQQVSSGNLGECRSVGAHIQQVRSPDRVFFKDCATEHALHS